MKRLHLLLAILSLPLMSNCSNNNAKNYADKNFDLASVALDAQNFYPVMVIGGGVAGLTAANYLAQANIPCIIVEGEKPGGALAQSDSVRNWPGILNAPGVDIVNALKSQVLSQGVMVTKEKAVTIDLQQWPYVIEVEDIQTKATRSCTVLACILAMGAEPNYLHIPGERGANGYWGRGVTNCAVCDGSLYKGKNVVVVGGGDSAIVEAAYLAGIANQVTVLVRKDHFRAKDKVKRDEVMARANVTVQFNSEVTKVLGDGHKVTHLMIKNSTTNETEKVAMDGLFLAIGAKPNTVMLKHHLELDHAGYIKLKVDQETSVPGVFAAGDICDPTYKQAVTSASDGCKAALQTQHFLQELNFDVAKSKHQNAKVSAAQPSKAKAKPSGIADIASVEQFKKIVAQNSLPVVVDLYANFCIPCQEMMPIVERLAQKFTGKVVMVKLNVSELGEHLDELMTMIAGAELSSVPSFLFVQDGKEVDRVEGSMTMQEFEQRIKTNF